MVWSKQTNSALQTWLVSPKWYCGHPRDDLKFFDFVGSAWDDEQSLWDEAMVREKIARAAQEFNEGQEHLITQGVDRAMPMGTLLLDFLCRMKANGRVLLPDGKEAGAER